MILILFILFGPLSRVMNNLKYVKSFISLVLIFVILAQLMTFGACDYSHPWVLNDFYSNLIFIPIIKLEKKSNFSPFVPCLDIQCSYIFIVNPLNALVVPWGHSQPWAAR